MSNIVSIGASSGIGLALENELILQGFQVYGTFNKTLTSADGFSNLQPLNGPGATGRWRFVKFESLVEQQ